jgi:hypothetical protein
MADTTFVSGTVVPVDWFNDINDNIYTQTSGIIGGTSRTLASKLGDFVFLEDQGGVGDWNGSTGTNNLTALTTALTNYKKIRLAPGKSYWLGNITSTTALFNLTGSNRVIDFNGGALVVTTSGSYQTPLFQLDNIDGFTLINPIISDTGYDTVTPVHIIGGKFSSMVAPLACTSAAYSAENIWFSGEAYNCYYGINLANNGHNLTADYRTYGAVRSYFCYGVTNHNIYCVSTNHNSIGNADFLIKCRDASYPTRNIKASFVSRTSLATTNPQLVFESQNNSGDAAITDCDIYYSDVLSTSCQDSIAFRHFNDAGTLQATDPNTKTRIVVRGHARGTVTYSSTPTATQDQDLDGALGVPPSFLAFVNAVVSNVTGDGTAYTILFNTEVSDTQSNYDTSTGIFTAPRDGYYTFAARALVQGRTAAETRVDLRLVTTARTLYNTATLTAGIAIPENSMEISVPRIYMKKNETAKVVLYAANGTKVVDLFGDSSIIATFFSGGLVQGSPKSN